MAKKLKTPEGTGGVIFTEGNGELSKLEINTAWSRAELYLHGAHLTHFQKKDEPPVLFMSQLSRFQQGTPIRGGIPVIFPWFGAREGLHFVQEIRPFETGDRDGADVPDQEVGVQAIFKSEVQLVRLVGHDELHRECLADGDEIFDGEF